MGKLIRCIAVDGTLSIAAIDATDIVNRAAEIHKTSAVTSAALGRLLCAASLMGSALKGADDSQEELTVQLILHDKDLPNDAFGQHFAVEELFNDKANQCLLFHEAIKYFTNILFIIKFLS